MSAPASQTPWKLIWALVIGLSLAMLALALLFPLGQSTNQARQQSAQVQSIDQQIQKVGVVNLQAGPVAAALPRSGEEVYKAQCAACHATGISGAPKFGDTAAWAPRIALGFDTLVQSPVKGKNLMPPQGNDLTSEFEVARAVYYMTTAAGAKFTEPAAPANTAAQGDGKAAGEAAALLDGAALYKGICASCHDAGVAGAPKFGDKAAWAPRLAAGLDTLVKSAINGKNAMPARGGSQYSDAEIKAVVEHMVAAVK